MWRQTSADIPPHSFTAVLVYRRAVGDGWASNPYGDAVPIPGRHTSQR